ncbi:hypothetical protein [Gemmatimonas sp.]|uniref:hypothetical protein n=1 Tax=Gemmatimonas sp. TaxID=1962908 RepID=UPI00356606CC
MSPPANTPCSSPERERCTRRRDNWSSRPTGTLLVAPFAQGTRALTGPAKVVSEGVRLAEVTAAGDFAVSTTGTLVYATAATGINRELVWVSRGGNVQPVDAPWQGAFKNPALSPSRSTGPSAATHLRLPTGGR